MDKKLNEISIPDELKIIINTNITGSPKIVYNSSMTIPNLYQHKNNVYFNPLVKLDKSKILSSSKDKRIKEFFYKSLFNELIKKHTTETSSNLLLASDKDYVSNNIQIILDILFPVDGILYVKGKPYVIIDCQWAKGDWVVQPKINENLLNKYKNQYNNLNPLHKIEVQTKELELAKKILETMPTEIKYGTNYIDKPLQINYTPTPIIPLPASSSSTSIGPNTLQITNVPSKTTPNTLQITNVPSKTTPNTLQITNEPSKPTPNTLQITNEPSIVPNTSLEINKRTRTMPTKIQTLTPIKLSNEKFENVLPINQPISSNNVGVQTRSSAIKNIPISTNIEVSSYIKTLNLSNNTEILQNYLLYKRYYNMINSLYYSMPNENQILINSLLERSLLKKSLKSTNLSKTAYNTTTKGIKLWHNQGRGDCFYIAITQALNIYNESSNIKFTKQFDSTLIGQNNDTLWNTTYLRESIYNEIITNTQLLEYINVNSTSNADELNKRYLDALLHNDYYTNPTNLSDKDLQTIINDIYSSGDNFFINIQPFVRPHISYTRIMGSKDFRYILQNKPFKSIETTNLKQIKQYIMSTSSWANEIMFLCVENIFKIKVIIIESYVDNVGDTNYRISQSTELTNNRNEWTHYVFLFYKNHHFELMSYEYSQEKLITIFNRIDDSEFTKLNFDIDIFPPISILFLIYASYYFTRKDNFSFLTPIFLSFDDAFKRINTWYKYLQNTSTTTNEKVPNSKENTEIFYKTFIDYFPENKNILTNTFEINIQQGGVNFMEDKSPLCYVIQIYLQVMEGTKLSPEQKKEANCIKKKNAINFEISRLFNKQFKLKPANNAKIKNTTIKNKSNPYSNKYSSRYNTYKSNPYNYDTYKSNPYSNKYSSRYNTYKSNPYNYNPYKSNSYNYDPYKSNPYKSNPYKSNPYKSNSYKSNPYKSNTYKSNPYKSNPYNYDPYKSNSYKSNPYSNKYSSRYKYNVGGNKTKNNKIKNKQLNKCKKYTRKIKNKQLNKCKKYTRKQNHKY